MYTHRRLKPFTDFLPVLRSFLRRNSTQYYRSRCSALNQRVSYSLIKYTLVFNSSVLSPTKPFRDDQPVVGGFGVRDGDGLPGQEKESTLVYQHSSGVRRDHNRLCDAVEDHGIRTGRQLASRHYRQYYSVGGAVFDLPVVRFLCACQVGYEGAGLRTVKNYINGQWAVSPSGPDANTLALCATIHFVRHSKFDNPAL